MYVNPFWFGVIATIAAETLALFVVAIFRGGQGGQK